jgi:hypothetical protein
MPESLRIFQSDNIAWHEALRIISEDRCNRKNTACSRLHPLPNIEIFTRIE